MGEDEMAPDEAGDETIRRGTMRREKPAAAARKGTWNLASTVERAAHRARLALARTLGRAAGSPEGDVCPCRAVTA